MQSIKEYVSCNPIERFTDYFILGRKIDSLLLNKDVTADKTLNIAILASSTVNGLKETLHVLCGERDIFSNIYVAEYNQYAQEILNPSSSLYTSEFDLIIVNIDVRAISGEYYINPYSLSAEERNNWVDDTTAFFEKLINNIVNKSISKVLFHNLEVPSYSPHSLVENKDKYGFIESIENINKNLRDSFKESNQVFIFDYNAFCSKHGKENIFDYKMYYMGDIKLKPQALPLLAKEYARYLYAIASINKKCIVLDLDNTLWGGVVGESGIEGIQLGPTPDGQPFLEFQKYLLSLFERGVILAINSKNNMDDAMAVINNHPYMILKEKHFAAMCINWDDKVSNMKKLAEEINIGLNSMVFFDDDHVNRDMVKQFIPEVEVVDLPGDPSLYVSTLIDLDFFDILSLTEEDKNKGKMYFSEKQRKKIKQNTTDLSEYLSMLDIAVSVEFASKNTIPRITQLTQKTNQFNMTTRRYSEEQISKMSDDSNYYVIALSLRDKFGDNGLTGLAIIDRSDMRKWRIDTFLLSCRILGRAAEDVLLAYVVSLAKKEGADELHGEFIESKKNVPAKEFYKKAGFEKNVSESDIEVWKFSLNKKFDFPDFIKCDVV